MIPKPRRGPWTLLAAIAALCIAVTVSFRIFDPDLWEHLAVGRWMWHAHRLPHAEIGPGPPDGTPAVLNSWGFRALLWPFFRLGGIAGLNAWRWLFTLATFGVLWSTARRMGARGVSAVVVLVMASLVWRQRSMIRPETLTAVLLALELAILETRRHGGRDHSVWLVPLLWCWVQAHVSFVFGFAVLAVYAAEAWITSRPSGASRLREPQAHPPSAARPALVFLAAGALALVNPYGWGLVRQPFEFFFHQRHEPLFQTIDELRPMNWVREWRNGLPLFVVGWPLLALANVVRRRTDRVELALCALFTTLGLTSQRFLGFYVLVAAVFVARDLASTWRAKREEAPLRWGPAAAAAALCVAVCVPEWARPEPRLGLGFDLRSMPVAACDFMEAHDVRGRSFNYFDHGGYLLWRFGAARDRLPFMDVHQAGTPAIRAAYLAAFHDRDAWHALDRAYGFEWLLLRRQAAAGDSMLEFADADTAYVPVFLDDAAALYVRRSGALAATAGRFGYRHVPGGTSRLEALGRACESDSVLRTATRTELERAVAESRWHARSASLLANVALIEGRYRDARRLLLDAQAVAPTTPLVTRRLEMIAARDSSGEGGER